MDRKGFVKIDRNLMGKPVFRNEKLLKVWIWCLLKATHEPYTEVVGLQKVQLEPGQFVTGRFAGAKETGLNPNTFWRYMILLQDNSSLVLKPNNKFTVVSIVNWTFYQVEKYLTEQQNNNKITTNEQQNNTNKNTKNIRTKDKKIIYAEYVTLTEPEYQKLVDKFGEHGTKSRIEKLNLYKGSKGVKYSSDYMTILAWERKDQDKNLHQIKPTQKAATKSYMSQLYEEFGFVDGKGGAREPT